MNLDKLSIDVESSKMARKLRVIAKHAGQLADELEAIDNEWQCDCGASDYLDECLRDDADKVYFNKRTCNQCDEQYALPVDDDLPTRFDGSE